MKNASALFLLLALLAVTAPALAYEEENRTVNRTPGGEAEYPSWLLSLPEHYEFLPLISNHDPQNQHPQQWQGQEWEPAAWNERWTEEVAIKKFFAAHIFERKYLQSKNVPVIEVGATFYKLSDLDRRRTLKLLIDNNKILENGFDVVILRDWYTKKVVGSYTRKGMQLN